MWRKLIITPPTWMTLPLRLALGLIFIGHGAQKVFGVWGGRGFSAFIANDAPFSFMRPSWLWMGAAAFAELVGGVLVLAGLLTRLGALMIVPTMLTAMFGVHWGAPIEVPVILLTGAAALAVAGLFRRPVFMAIFLALGALIIAVGLRLGFLWGWGMPNFFSNNRGIEYVLALLAMALALLISGGGQASIDRLLMDPRDRRR